MVAVGIRWLNYWPLVRDVVVGKRKKETDSKAIAENEMKTKLTDVFAAGRRLICQAADVFKKSANKAPEPTTTSVTHPACAGCAPDAVAAHL